LTVNDTDAEVADFVLSCRSMGRGVEQAMLYSLTCAGQRLGAGRLIAHFRPTARNGPCKEFLDAHSGLERLPDESTYAWRLESSYPLPAHITLKI
jgi:predicted enzyme involved in methoxymalonyl-ACP biosynthesis